MATSFPGSLDSFVNPSGSDALDSVSVPHATQHADLNDAVEALEAKVGVNGSAVTTSLDYKVAQQGLVLVKSQTIGSGVASVTVTDAFSAQFYNYRIVLASGYAAGTVVLRFTFESQSGNMYGNRLEMISNNATITNVNTGGGGQAYAEIGYVASSRQGFASLDVYSPFVARRKGITGNYYGAGYNGTVGYENNVTNSYTGFVLTPASGTLLGGEIFVYGYNNG